MNRDYFKGIRRFWSAVVTTVAGSVVLSYVVCWIPTIYLLFSMIYQQTALANQIFLAGPLGGLFGTTCLVSIISTVAIRYEYPNLLYIGGNIFAALGYWASVNIIILLFYVAAYIPSQVLWFLFGTMMPAILVWQFVSAVQIEVSKKMCARIEERTMEQIKPVIVSKVMIV